MVRRNILVNQHKKHQTIIIGGGIIGATLALKLAKNQQDVLLIEARPHLTEQDWAKILQKRDARVYALSLASMQLLKEVGAWQIIEQHGRKADYTQMQVWQTNGVGELQFGDQQNPTLLGSMVEPFIIEHALYQQFTEKNVAPYLTHIAGHKLKSIDWLGANVGYQILLDNGDTHLGQLLVGADGRQSIIRQQANIGLDTLNYHQTAICCAIQTEKPHQQTARQVFLTDGILALLPLADVDEIDKQNPQHWQSIVWTLPSEKAQQFLALSPEQLAKEVAFASGYALGEITAIQSIASFPLNAQHAKSYVKPNLALIGDSAHGVHPLAGQGLNLGMLDIIALSDCLQKDFKRSQGKQWASFTTLQHYERQRYANNAMMMHSFSGINWLFGSNIRPIQHLRSEAVNQVSKIRPMMQFFSKKASGL